MRLRPQARRRVWLMRLVSVPFVNLLAVPLCIVAGTLFYVDRIRGRPGAGAAGAQAATRARRTPTS